jgi:TonB-dependent starch-binding outer membrane protein SusC
MRKKVYFTKKRAGGILISGLILCLLTLSSQSSYAESGQQTITLNFQNASLEKVFAEIEKQTHYNFLYMQSVLKNARQVNVKVANATLEKVLEMCFKDQPHLTYSIMDRVVVVKVKPAPAEGPVRKGVEDPIDVSGRVTDEEGKPLVGANVKVRGNSTGVVTDAEGKFMLKNVEENAVLEISYVGHEPQVVFVKGQRMLAVNLKQNQSMLDETVVIAYGTTTKRLNTGNVASVKAKEIENQPVNNPLLALQGRVPGIFITQSTGLPGSGVTVRIQGKNSIGNGNDPFYVVDGVPYISQLLSNNPASLLGGVLGNSGYSGISGNPFSFLNPSDIESIEILKDADATAIYGSRAANGAILITTKKGRAGTTKVNVNVQTGWGKITRKLDLMNTEQFIEMRQEAISNDGLLVSETDYDINGHWDANRYTDWQDELIGGTAKYNNINATVSGGNSNTQVLVGVNYHNETTVFPGSFGDKKGSLHFHINNVSPNQKFRFQLSGSYLVDKNELISTDLTRAAILLAPNAPSLYNEDGSINWALNSNNVSTWTNPLSYLLNTYDNKSSNLIANASLSYRIFPGLEIRNSFGYTNFESNEVSIFPLQAVSPEYQPITDRYAFYSDNSINSWVVEPQIDYKRGLGNGKVEILFGATLQQRNNNGLVLTGSGYNSDLKLENVGSAASVYVVSTTSSKYKYNAVFGRINYSFKDKYILNLTGRRDGSSRFGEENRFHNFGAFGAGWIFTEEKYVKSTLSFLSFGKIWGSYGTTGNDQIGDYQYMNLYPPINVGVPYQNAIGLGVNSLPNPYLEWEETKKLQAGIDLGLVADKIIFKVDYFHNRSFNQLLNYALPIMTGFRSITSNFPALVKNYGWEFSFNAQIVKRQKFTWSSNFNLTIPKNKLISFPNLSSSSSANSLVIGQPITIVKAYEFLGVDPSTGLYEFNDGKEGKTSRPDTASSLMQTKIINTSPKFYGGFQNRISYKGFQLDLLFQFVKQIGPNYYFGFNPGAFGLNQPISVLNRWQKIGDISNIQRYNSDYKYNSEFSNASTYSDAAYTDASYIRLKNLSISWNFPDQLVNKIHLETVRLYMQGQNLFTITDYEGLDPENQSTISLPPLRVFTIGIQVGL